jgi:hypothetical protein
LPGAVSQVSVTTAGLLQVAPPSFDHTNSIPEYCPDSSSVLETWATILIIE